MFLDYWLKISHSGHCIVSKLFKDKEFRVINNFIKSRPVLWKIIALDVHLSVIVLFSPMPVPNRFYAFFSGLRSRKFRKEGMGQKFLKVTFFRHFYNTNSEDQIGKATLFTGLNNQCGGRFPDFVIECPAFHGLPCYVPQ